MSLVEKNFVFLDVETTGLEVNQERICQIGLLKTKGLKPIDFFSSFINPDKRITPGAYAVHHIDDKDLRKSPFFYQIADKILSFIGTDIICGYNIIFDISFINKELNLINQSPLKNTALDILPLVKDTFPALGKYNLENIIRFLQLPFKAHNAIDDVWATYHIFSYIVKEKAVELKDDIFLTRYRIKI